MDRQVYGYPTGQGVKWHSGKVSDIVPDDQMPHNCEAGCRRVEDIYGRGHHAEFDMPDLNVILRYRHGRSRAVAA